MALSLLIIAGLLAIFTPIKSTTVGGYSEITDTDELADVDDLVNEVKSDVIELVNIYGCIGCDDDCTVSVQSAQKQVVAGINYIANIAVCDDLQSFDISFYQPLPVNNTEQEIENVQIYTTTTDSTTVSPSTTAQNSIYGGYTQITATDDLSDVLDLCLEIESDILSLVNADTTCDISVNSAYKQVVAGTNYIVNIAVCDEDYNIKFFVALPSDGVAQDPSNLALVTSTTTSSAPITVGGYTQVTDDDELDTIEDLCIGMETDILGLVDADSTCDIAVISAYKQVVAGTNYRVNVEVCDETYDISFFVPLPQDGEAQDPVDLALVGATTETPLVLGGYTMVTDEDELSNIQTLCDNMKEDIFGLVTADSTCDITVISAYKQVVAGTNYRVKLNICEDIYDISFFVPLPVDGEQQAPESLTLLTSTDLTVGGYDAITDTDDLAMVVDMCQNMETDIIALTPEDLDCDISVLSAYKQVVTGMNYRVEISICDNIYDIQFYVPLPVNGEAQAPEDLKLFGSTTATPVSLPGGYHQVNEDELDIVGDYVEDLRTEIFETLENNGCEICTDDCSMNVVIAYSQVVAGTNYKVKLSVCEDIEEQIYSVQFYVPLPSESGIASPEADSLTLIADVTTTATPEGLETDDDDEEINAKVFRVAIAATVTIICAGVIIMFVIYMRKRNKAAKTEEGYKNLLNNEISTDAQI